MKKTGTKTNPKMSSQIKRAVEASDIAKAEAHTAAFKMINLNPTTYETSKNRTQQSRT
jgi:hypothetical protein